MHNFVYLLIKLVIFLIYLINNIINIRIKKNEFFFAFINYLKKK